jgi:hypothetical protein
MNKYLTLMMTLLLISLGSGCIGDDKPLSEPLKDVIQITEHNHTDSYQFTNYAPMGIGNSTDITLNGTNMSVWININISAGFHVPLLWEQGSVNVSILDENETVLWTNKTSGGQSNYTLVVSDNYSYNGNLTLRILSDGSDNATDGEVADWYVVRYEIWSQSEV